MLLQVGFKVVDFWIAKSDDDSDGGSDEDDSGYRETHQVSDSEEEGPQNNSAFHFEKVVVSNMNFGKEWNGYIAAYN